MTLSRTKLCNMFLEIFYMVFSSVAATLTPFDVYDGISSPAESFAEFAALPGVRPLPGTNIFRRQSCPNLSLLCPSGICCSYATTLTTCCGQNCCAQGYLCTGGTQSNPCCVAIGSTTNVCGSVNINSNVRNRSTYHVCDTIATGHF